MSSPIATIESLIAEAGARADSLGGFAKELFLHLESRFSAIETRIASLETFSNPVARAGQAAVALALSPGSSNLKSAAKAAAAALEQAIAEDGAATAAAAAEAEKPAAEPAEPAAHT